MLGYLLSFLCALARRIFVPVPCKDGLKHYMPKGSILGMNVANIPMSHLIFFFVDSRVY